MKHVGVLLFFCLCVLECSAKNGVDTLCIRFLSWDTYNLPHIVTCNNFEDELPYTEHRVCSKTAVVKLLESLKNLHQTVDSDFSVGCKLFFLCDGNVVKKVCLNSKYVLMDGRTFICTQELMNTIDDVIKEGIVTNTHYNYDIGKYGNEYMGGRDSLFLKIDHYLARKLPKSIKNVGDIRIVVYCKADKNGRSTQVKIRLYNRILSKKQEKRLEKLLNYFFFHEVKWKPDETRMLSDWIVLNHKIKGGIIERTGN